MTIPNSVTRFISEFNLRYDRFCELLQEWASYRGQVLMRTVYGIMYYEHAVRMQASH